MNRHARARFTVQGNTLTDCVIAATKIARGFFEDTPHSFAVIEARPIEAATLDNPQGIASWVASIEATEEPWTDPDDDRRSTFDPKQGFQTERRR